MKQTEIKLTVGCLCMFDQKDNYGFVIKVGSRDCKNCPFFKEIDIKKNKVLCSK